MIPDPPVNLARLRIFRPGDALAFLFRGLADAKGADMFAGAGLTDLGFRWYSLRWMWKP
jgi:hypothetical protein